MTLYRRGSILMWLMVFLIALGLLLPDLVNPGHGLSAPNRRTASSLSISAVIVISRNQRGCQIKGPRAKNRQR